jgi:hypothetical protein
LKRNARRFWRQTRVHGRFVHRRFIHGRVIVRRGRFIHGIVHRRLIHGVVVPGWRVGIVVARWIVRRRLPVSVAVAVLARPAGVAASHCR